MPLAKTIWTCGTARRGERRLICRTMPGPSLLFFAILPQAANLDRELISSRSTSSNFPSFGPRRSFRRAETIPSRRSVPCIASPPPRSAPFAHRLILLSARSFSTLFPSQVRQADFPSLIVKQFSSCCYLLRNLRIAHDLMKGAYFHDVLLENQVLEPRDNILHPSP